MPKMTASERTELKKAIEAFYKKVGRTWGDRPVNYCVAENFAIMIHEALKATDSLAWLPAPSMKPNLRWLLSLLVKGTYRRSQK
ncbi:hypothetical protein MNBD_GAMMA22-1157 [hydrothermal vent metagenome]|uniref:Uncharacterized protein n=1 Tax=hydrothermal vent metagenome TaxID=652676 RepID=A0A3B1A319_9ZZZZ